MILYMELYRFGKGASGPEFGARAARRPLAWSTPSLRRRAFSLRYANRFWPAGRRWSGYLRHSIRPSRAASGGDVDLPFDRRGARRTIVGERECSERCRLSVHGPGDRGPARL